MSIKRDCSVAPEVYWFWGKTGTGKTRKVFDENPDVYVWSGTWPWFHGYEDQTTVLFDNFCGEIPFNQLLRLLDRYPMTVETKDETNDGLKNWLATKIYITSIFPPDMMSSHDPKYREHDKAALKRRISEIVYFDDAK
jgi:hypothetical protein